MNSCVSEMQLGHMLREFKFHKFNPYIAAVPIMRDMYSTICVGFLNTMLKFSCNGLCYHGIVNNDLTPAVVDLIMICVICIVKLKQTVHRYCR